MSTQARHCLRLVGVFTITGLLTSLAVAQKKIAEGPSVRIGLMKSLFRDAPDSLRQVLMEPFRTLTESQTGIKSELETAATAYELGQKLNENKIQLGVFNGIEFGWAQQDFPRLKPLLIGVNKHRELFAHLVVVKDSKLKDFAELQNQTVALPRWSRHHCHLFFEHCQQEARRQHQDFKTHVATPKGTEAALDDLVRGKVQACVADGVALESYQREKPGSYEKLKTLKKSEAFPSAVVAYLPGVLAEETLARFRAGMKRANETSVGRQLLATSRLTGFENVPAEYHKMVTEIVKLYPALRLTRKESVSGKQPSRHDGHH
jgi:ABC-type phosphate/phosphonate transport system substrate-binding protein